MSTQDIIITEVAKKVGLTVNRIQQLIYNKRLAAIEKDGDWFVYTGDVDVLHREQSYLRPGEARQLLGITKRQYDLLLTKKILVPKNKVSELALFNPEDIAACAKAVENSYSIDETAKQLDLSKRAVYRMIADGLLDSVETVHGQRVPRTALVPE
jgi:excisionase family DNA binding protein